MQVADRPRVAARPGLRLWREALYIGCFYGAYTLVRNRFGSEGQETEHARRAFHHAQDVIKVERAVGLFREATIQGWFLSWHWFIRFWNVFYGSAHFIVTGAALIWCYRYRTPAYRLWRNTLAATTALALVGFSTFSLMPPRLLDNASPIGAAQFSAVHYGFVDTLQKIGGSWSFDSGTMQRISNQYAAMPSLHCAWALWVVLVLWPRATRRWAKALLILYPAATLFCIIVTANHYWLDGVAGAVTLGLGYLVGRWLTTRTRPTPAIA